MGDSGGQWGSRTTLCLSVVTCQPPPPCETHSQLLRLFPPRPSAQAPFCVHPKTGRVCVPIDPAAAWEFDPDAVCTVGALLNQLNSSSSAGAAAAAAAGEEPWRGTDMGPAVDTFRACFLDALQADVRAGLAEKARAAAAAPTLAW